jgi:glycine/D-amino acid oxidase-like deaminating enzyme
MDLKSGYPYWAVKNGLMHAFPQLHTDVRCDVAVIGGGITGALIADELGQAGHDVVVLEQRDAGWGSTAASTALLQYEIDEHLVTLANKFGVADAVLAYRSSVNAIDELHHRAESLGDVDFALQHSLYLASSYRAVRELRAEFELREAHGFPVTWIETSALDAVYGVQAPAAILSHAAARVDPYRMAYRLLSRHVRRGGQVYDRTTIATLTTSSRSVRLETHSGHSVTSRRVVMAAGYANTRWLTQRVAQIRSSFAFITDPIDPAVLGPLADTLVWETARPYRYVRTTGDHRLLVGGADDPEDDPQRRDRRLRNKTQQLIRGATQLFPDRPFVPAFSWAGAFAETADGLPFFGAHPQHGDRVLFAMAFGGNGITFSMLGAQLLRAIIERRAHPLRHLFSFDRLQ